MSIVERIIAVLIAFMFLSLIMSSFKPKKEDVFKAVFTDESIEDRIETCQCICP